MHKLTKPQNVNNQKEIRKDWTASHFLPRHPNTTFIREQISNDDNILQTCLKDGIELLCKEE